MLVLVRRRSLGQPLAGLTREVARKQLAGELRMMRLRGFCSLGTALWSIIGGAYQQAGAQYPAMSAQEIGHVYPRRGGWAALRHSLRSLMRPAAQHA